MTLCRQTYRSTSYISFEATGEGERPMVLLHGLGASLESWNDILPLLSAEFRIYRLDLKGHGLSDKPRDDRYSLNEHARIVTTFIKDHQLQDVVLLGHSYGGAVALLTCSNLGETGSPNPITAMVLLAAAAYPQSLPFYVALLRNPVLNLLVQYAIPARTRAKQALKRIFYDQTRVTDERIDRYARYFGLPGAYYALTQCARQIVPDEDDAILNKMRRIVVPTLIIWGANDLVIKAHDGERLRNDIGPSQLRIIQEQGHIPHEEKPAETADIIRTFLRRK